MNDHIDFIYDESTGHSTVTIKYNNIVITGEAQCSPEDKEIQSEFLGLALAEKRASRKYLAAVREQEILPGLKSLKQLYYSMKHSSQFNPKSYEAKMLFRQIKYHEEDLAYIKNTIKMLKEEEKFLLHKIEMKKRSRS